MHVDVPSINFSQLQQTNNREESSSEVRKRVCSARTRQLQRSAKPNTQLSNQELKHVCHIDDDCIQILEVASKQLGLSARAYHRILRLARTIADIDRKEDISPSIVAEAISYRRLDRQSPIFTH